LSLQSYLGHGLAVLRVRPFNHIGPGQRSDFVAPAIAKRIAIAELEGNEVVSVGNLSPRRDFTDVRDVVRAYRLLIEKGEPGEVYNVCSGKDVAIRELAVLLTEMSTKTLRLEPDPALQRPVDVPVLRGDPTKLRKTTGWEPQIALEKTLAEILEEWRAKVRVESAAILREKGGRR
jgi:GDP-4-dehydro-6-deoxy-D-mannose reductase